MSHRLLPTDAQTYWMSAKIPNDQFLLFCFDTDASADSVRAELLRNASGVDELHLRITDTRWGLTFPRWDPMAVGDGHVREHDSASTWNNCLGGVADLVADQLDPRETTWRIHLFADVTHAPRGAGPALVAILQISHALGDGRTASALARRLFGDSAAHPDPIVDSGRPSPTNRFAGAREAAKAERRLAADTEAGVVPPQAPGRTKTRVDVAPDGPIAVRTVVRNRCDFTAPGISVTVGALTAVSHALTRYLTMHGDSAPADLGAEVTLSKPGARRARNHFRNAGVGLHPTTTDLVERARSIGRDLSERRTRAAHPAMQASSLAAEMVPAALLRWGIRQFDATAVPERVTGNTVVSSVARGDAGLVVGGGRVRFTAGFPALSPVMGLTHGVHGIGDSVTLGVMSAHSAVPDPDVYEQLLRRAVDDVADAFARVT
ncbi:MAG: WS/DGAT domain-containing protein [Rhodococcus sp. (in: high G+C Gram-positive bacteria)]